MTSPIPAFFPPGKLGWLLNRLRCMSPAEVVYRAGRTMQARGERALLPFLAGAPAADLRCEGRPWIAGDAQVAPAVYLAAAERILAGRYDVFDLNDIELGSPPDWNRDPRTGTLAPRTFGKTLNYRDEALVGDIKCLWEPNRHLHLVTLAQAWRLSGDRRFLEAIGQHLSSWFEACPYGCGPNWASSLEAGIRLINWSLAWQLIGGMTSPLFEGAGGDVLRRRWLASIYQHQRFIVGHFSLHSSANNHLLGEAAGLFVATMTWPMWSTTPRWIVRAQRILEEQVLRQNTGDGVNREQAVWYAQFVFDFLLLPMLAGDANGAPFSRFYRERLEAMLEYVSSIMDVAGHVPMIGDGDNGLVVCLDPRPDASTFHSQLATGAVLFGRGDFRRKARHFDERSRWLLGDEAENRFAELVRLPAHLPVRQAFPEGGYYVLGCDFEHPEEVRVVADAGPLGYLSIAAHGHADALSFTLSVAGREILVDPGTYCYHTEKAWREYFRSTAAHNTLTVDDLGQSVSGGNFMWLHKANSVVEHWHSNSREDVLEASHDGYARLDDPVTHRRRLCFDKPNRKLEVRDVVSGHDPHHVAILWHFAETCEVRLDGNMALVMAGGQSVTVRLPDPGLGKAQLYCGSTDPVAGWISRRFGERRPSPTLIWRGTVPGGTTLITEIICGAR